MNSINFSAASTGSNLTLLQHSHRLTLSRQSLALSTYSISSAKMAAAMVSSNQGKASADSSDDHHPHRQLPKVDDPVELRTCTVDEAFRRMEELVGSEEEEKNWKGIVIALLVIGFILGMIAMAIVLVTPAAENYNPGKPLPFTVLTDPSVQLQKPVFSWVRGSDKYVQYVQLQKGTENYIERYAVLAENATKSSETVLLPQSIISGEMRGVEAVTASPDTNYALAKMNSESNSIINSASYRIYNKRTSSVIELADGKLQFADWIGLGKEMVYIHNNNIYYKESPEVEATAVTSDGSSSILNGLPDKTYKVYIFPKLDSLIWASPFNSKFAFCRIDKSTSKSYHADKSSADSVTLHVYDKEVRQLNLTALPGYVSAVTWMDANQLMIVWLEMNHQIETYFICESNNGICKANFQYSSSQADLKWVGLYGSPVYNADKSEYYTLLPDPANENKLYRHVAAIKTDDAIDQRVAFLTCHSWSDLEIIGLDNSKLYYLSTGSNFTHQHLFSLDTNTKESVCLTCQKHILSTKHVFYIEALFSFSYSYVYLSVLGPDIPTFHVVRTETLYSGEVDAAQIDETHHAALVAAYEDVHLPKVEFLTIPLSDGSEASVKLVLPSIFNRDKSCYYETVVITSNIPGNRIATQQFSLGFQEYLAKNQTFIIALVDGRGAGGRGEMLRQSIYGALGLAESRDISDVISFLAKHAESYKIDKNFVAVMGKDYGGYVSMHAAAYSLIKCAVISAPIFTLPKYGWWLTDRYMYNASLVPSQLNYNCMEASVTCSKLNASSVLLLHGTEDAVVAVDNSMELIRDLQKAGYSFRQQMYPNVGSSLETADIAAHYYHTVTNYLSECFKVEQRIDESVIDFCANRE